MRIFLIAFFVLSAGSTKLLRQAHAADTAPADVLHLTESDRTHEIVLQVTVNNTPFDEYWTNTFHAIFDFADANGDEALSEDELPYVPSARAVRLSLGTGFSPPVAALQSLQEIVSGGSSVCSKDDLASYYRRQGVGRVTIGHGKIPHTAALTTALIRALDQDHDAMISEAELSKAEVVLRRLDSNDDELIGAGELVPNQSYPGSSAANVLRPSAPLDLSQAGDGSLVLMRGQSNKNSSKEAAPASSVDWHITIADPIKVSPLSLAAKAHVEVWTVPSPLGALRTQLREELASAEAVPLPDTKESRTRGRQASHAWLTPLVDRDRNGTASPEEIDRWLDLQRQLCRGHLLISLYHGGGLFELLDSNHDAALSIRELREAWRVLEAAACTIEDRGELARVPNVIMIVVSQGYPNHLALASPSELEWFRQMDRNSDGDVSRREFTGLPETFGRLDRDKDGLISMQEAERSKTLCSKADSRMD